MAVHDILPDTNLRDVDIRDTLGLGSNVMKDYFDANIINWSSKFKPVVSTTLFHTLDEWQDDGYKGDDGMCGLTPAYVSGYSSIPSLYDGDMNGWEYNVPSGSSGEPLRMGDFRGYCHEAVPMVSNFYVPNRVSSLNGGRLDADMMIAADGGNSITLADLALSSCYSALVVTDSNGTVKGTAVGFQISGGAYSVSASLSSLNMTSTGTYICYPMLINASSVASSGKFYSIPNVNPKSVNVVSSYFTVAVMAWKSETESNTVEYKITINNTSTAVTWTNNTYRLRFQDKTFSDTLVSGEKSGSLNDGETITVPANNSLTLTGSITGISSTLFNESVLRLWVSFNSGNVVQDAIIVENTQE